MFEEKKLKIEKREECWEKWKYAERGERIKHTKTVWFICSTAYWGSREHNFRMGIIEEYDFWPKWSSGTVKIIKIQDV
jgi:hypothetical protein